ncbi:MAG: A24 family peptidase [Chloroflexi bacterium]|nr:A24 family peptidase [Chloroflexota bacterium]
MTSNLLVALIFIVFGVIIGGLLNLVAKAISFTEPRTAFFSPCHDCSRSWQFKYLIPVIGYILSGRHCPYCQASLPVRIILVEIFTGLLFAFIYWRYGFTWELAMLVFYSSVFIVLLVTDIEQMLLPNIITYPAMIIALVIALLITLFNYVPSWAFVFPPTGFLGILNNYLFNSVLGGVTGFILLLVVALIFRGGMGGGDIKLAGLMGMVMGFPLILVALFLGIMGGGLIAAFLLIARLKGRKETIPFGPFLCLASIAALFWGKDLLIWYLRLI